MPARARARARRRASSGWQDSKADTAPHRLEDAGRHAVHAARATGVHNGEAYVAKLPRPADHRPGQGAVGHATLWWSQAGQRLRLPADQAATTSTSRCRSSPTCPPGTQVTLTFKSRVGHRVGLRLRLRADSTDDGKTYSPYASAERLHDAAPSNPNPNGCQAQVRQRPHRLERLLRGRHAARSTASLGNYPDAGVRRRLLRHLRPRPARRRVLRFSYATDPGLARPGWFIDDLDDHAPASSVIYSTDFETAATDDPRVFNGGCREDAPDVADACTHGWQYVDADAEVARRPRLLPGDARPLRLRRSTARARTTATPIGVQRRACSLVYTDEAHGYGNVGTDDPPAQTPLDAVPEPAATTPNLNDAAVQRRRRVRRRQPCRQLHRRRRQLGPALRLPEVRRDAGWREPGSGAEVFGSLRPRSRRDVHRVHALRRASTTATARSARACRPRRRRRSRARERKPTAVAAATAVTHSAAAPKKAVACATRKVRARGALSAIRRSAACSRSSCARRSRVGRAAARSRVQAARRQASGPDLHAVRRRRVRRSCAFCSGRTTLTLTLPR